MLFKKPAWLKPEVNELKYWLHILLVTIIVLFVLQLFKTLVVIEVMGNLFNLKNILMLSVLWAFADITVHTVLKY